MPNYVLGHELRGEGARLALISELLDPMHRRYIDALGVVKPGAHALEVGCGNGSISAWLAERVSPGGTAVAVDLDLSLIHVRMPNLELRKADIVAGPVERGTFDLVTGRAVLHHVTDAQAAIVNMVAGLKTGARFF
ncbi:MAG TPA: methyltransferase domain-containing protein [Candidatus Udaeobacter sp.]|nr:methyltransferase domain-containing protein [Candidatus Udaeobacter sp.]